MIKNVKMAVFICSTALLLVGCGKQSTNGNTKTDSSSKSEKVVKNQNQLSKLSVASQTVKALNNPDTKVKVVKTNGGALAVYDVAKVVTGERGDVGKTYAYTNGTQGLSIVNIAKQNKLGSTGANIISRVVNKASNDSLTANSIGLDNAYTDYIGRNLSGTGSYSYNYIAFNNMHVVKNPKGYDKGTISIKGNVVLNYNDSGQDKNLVMSISDTEPVIVSDTTIKPISKTSLKRISKATYTNKDYPVDVVSSKTND